MPRFAWERIGAGARLGSPPVTAGVEVRPAAAELAEESALESGFVGFLRYAVRGGIVNMGDFEEGLGWVRGTCLRYSCPWSGRLRATAILSRKVGTCSCDIGPSASRCHRLRSYWLREHLPASTSALAPLLTVLEDRC